MPKYSENGVRLCDQKDCDLPATHTFVWTDSWVCNCKEHTQGMLNLGRVMGHPTPGLTVRPLIGIVGNSAEESKDA